MTVTDDQSPELSHNALPADCEWAAFTETAPWVLSADSIAWSGLDVVRDQAKAEVPKLTRPGKVPNVGRMLVVVGRMGWAVGNWWVRKRLRRFSSTEASRRSITTPPQCNRVTRSDVHQVGSNHFFWRRIVPRRTRRRVQKVS